MEKILETKLQRLPTTLKRKELNFSLWELARDKVGKFQKAIRYLTDKNGNEVVSKLNAKSLEKLADMTKGDYFEISDGRNDVAKLITAISKIKGEFRDAKDIDTSANRYFYFFSWHLF